MRFSRICGAVTAFALLATVPALGQTTPQTPPPAPTLTPPGSTTGVPLVPNAGGANAMPGGGVTMPPMPTVTLPGNGMGTMGMGAYPGMGGTGDLSTLLSANSNLPLTMTLGQLDSSWRRMTVTGTIDLGSVTQVVSSLMGSAGIGVYYTKGQTVNVGNTTYLVAYRTSLRVLDVAKLLETAQTAMMSAKPPAPEVLTRDTPLALSLLNLQTTGSLTDIRPFDLQRELADSQAAVHAYNQVLQELSAMGSSATPATPKPAHPYHPAPHKKSKML